MRYLLAIDQGTTSTRAILFDSKLRPCASNVIPLRQYFPANGWVEHDAEEIWQSTASCCRDVTKDISANEVAAIGITNQRETTVLWDRKSGNALHNAIVWQDRRTAERCHRLQDEGREEFLRDRTGLLIDPYFSASKLEWLLTNVEGAGARAKNGELAFGTIDSWLIYRLTGGRVHASDTTNASRTMLFNIHSLDWDAEVLRLFGVPAAVLPKVQECTSDFGATNLLGEPIRIAGVAGDQQSASFGQACFGAGDVKCTFGTGCFALVNTGANVIPSQNRLITTVAYSMQGKTTYAIEGSIFVAGAVVQWLRDALGIIKTSDEVDALAAQAKEIRGVYFVPAFTGLGAPYWDAYARGAILGLTRDAGAPEIARAALDAVCYQTRDLFEGISADMKAAGLRAPETLRVDGGMVKSNAFCQRLADLVGLPVERPRVTETTALGAAALAGLGVGMFKTLGEIAELWSCETRYEPAMASPLRDELYDGWRQAVARVRTRSGLT